MEGGAVLLTVQIHDRLSSTLEIAVASLPTSKIAWDLFAPHSEQLMISVHSRSPSLKTSKKAVRHIPFLPPAGPVPNPGPGPFPRM